MLLLCPCPKTRKKPKLNDSRTRYRAAGHRHYCEHDLSTSISVGYPLIADNNGSLRDEDHILIILTGTADKDATLKCFRSVTVCSVPC